MRPVGLRFLFHSSVTLAALLAAGCSPAAAPAGRVTLKMDSFVVRPGEELYRCQNFANPFAGRDANVARWQSRGTTGQHHFLAYLGKNLTHGPVNDCSQGIMATMASGGLTGLVFDAETPEVEKIYPEGVAQLIKGDEGISFDVHYINTTDHDITATVELDVEIAEASTVKALAGTMLLTNTAINLPPHAAGQTVVADCAIDRNIRIITAQSHMHRFGVGFEAVAGATGRSLYATNEWSHPPLSTFDQPFEVASGERITVTCSYENTSDQPVRFGQSVATDEMCVLFGTYYPVPEGAEPAILCGVSGGGPGGAPVDRDAVKVCACSESMGKCRSECATSACVDVRPDDACMACVNANCS